LFSNLKHELEVARTYNPVNLPDYVTPLTVLRVITYVM